MKNFVFAAGVLLAGISAAASDNFPEGRIYTCMGPAECGGIGVSTSRGIANQTALEGCMSNPSPLCSSTHCHDNMTCDAQTLSGDPSEQLQFE